jgi:hypothetical protein
MQRNPGIGLGGLLEEGKELGVAVAGFASVTLPVAISSAANRGGGAVPGVVVGLALDVSWAHRQHHCSPVNLMR